MLPSHGCVHLAEILATSKSIVHKCFSEKKQGRTNWIWLLLNIIWDAKTVDKTKQHELLASLCELRKTIE